MTYLLALDQGTSSSRSIVFDADGRTVAMAQREFRQIYPQPGWVEHDPEDLWQTQLATAQEALAKASITAAQVKAIGITNQRETTVVWNRRTGRPIHNAIVWQDRRGEPLCAQLRDQSHAEAIRRSTGLVVDAYFSATKIRWILDHVPGAHIAAAHGDLAFGTVDSWLLWKLTGGRVHATDVSNAARTMLFDIRHNVWDHELLKLLHVPDSLLPAVHPSSHVFGETDAALLGASIPVAGMAGDQQSALFGQACFSAGSVQVVGRLPGGPGCASVKECCEGGGGLNGRAGGPSLGRERDALTGAGTEEGGTTMKRIALAALFALAVPAAASADSWKEPRPMPPQAAPQYRADDLRDVRDLDRLLARYDEAARLRDRRAMARVEERILAAIDGELFEAQSS